LEMIDGGVPFQDLMNLQTLLKGISKYKSANLRWK